MGWGVFKRGFLIQCFPCVQWFNCFFKFLLWLKTMGASNTTKLLNVETADENQTLDRYWGRCTSYHSDIYYDDSYCDEILHFYRCAGRIHSPTRLCDFHTPYKECNFCKKMTNEH